MSRGLGDVYKRLAVNDALKKAADKTKQVAEQGVDDAEEKARAWKEKQKERREQREKEKQGN